MGCGMHMGHGIVRRHHVCAMPYALGMGGMALGALDLGCQMSYPQPEPTRTNPTQASTSFLLVVLSLVTGQRAPLLVAHRTLEVAIHHIRTADGHINQVPRLEAQGCQGLSAIIRSPICH